MNCNSMVKCIWPKTIPTVVVLKKVSMCVVLFEGFLCRLQEC